MSCYFLASKANVLILFLCFVVLKLALELCTRVIFKSCLPQRQRNIEVFSKRKIEIEKEKTKVSKKGNN